VAFEVGNDSVQEVPQLEFFLLAESLCRYAFHPLHLLAHKLVVGLPLFRQVHSLESSVAFVLLSVYQTRFLHPPQHDCDRRRPQVQFLCNLILRYAFVSCDDHDHRRLTRVQAVFFQLSVEDVEVEPLDQEEPLQNGVLIHPLTLSIDVEKLDVNMLSLKPIRVKGFLPLLRQRGDARCWEFAKSGIMV